MDIDDRIHLIGATQRLVDALAEQCDRARRGGEQVKEALEIGRGQIARVRHALQIVTNVDPFQKTFRNSDAPVQKAFIEQPFPAAMRQKAVHQRNVTARPERSEEHTSKLQSLMRTSYAVFC